MFYFLQPRDLSNSCAVRNVIFDDWDIKGDSGRFENNRFVHLLVSSVSAF